MRISFSVALKTLLTEPSISAEQAGGEILIGLSVKPAGGSTIFASSFGTSECSDFDSGFWTSLSSTSLVDSGNDLHDFGRIALWSLSLSVRILSCNDPVRLSETSTDEGRKELVPEPFEMGSVSVSTESVSPASSSSDSCGTLEVRVLTDSGVWIGVLSTRQSLSRNPSCMAGLRVRLGLLLPIVQSFPFKELFLSCCTIVTPESLSGCLFSVYLLKSFFSPTSSFERFSLRHSLFCVISFSDH